MTGANFLEAMAVHLAWMEASMYGINEQLAVLFCLRNRLAAGWLNGDLSCILRNAFLFDQTNKIFDLPDPRDPAFQQLLTLAESVFDNTAKDYITDGAVYWGVNKPHDAKERVAQVGQLLLWK